MNARVVLTVLLHVGVTWLLLMAAGRLCGRQVRALRCAAGALVRGCWAGAWMLGGFPDGEAWQLGVLAAVSWIAYGGALRCWGVFGLLILAMEGLPGRNGWLLAPVAVGVWLLSADLGEKTVGERCVPVRLCHGGHMVQLLALRDTGNTLVDPVSGEPVLVLGAEAARRLTGLTVDQLRKPVETVASGVLPGLRLVPYRAVGSSGMLAALRLDGVWINGKPAGRLAAFAPEGLDGRDAFQALTGGMP